MKTLFVPNSPEELVMRSVCTLLCSATALALSTAPGSAQPPQGRGSRQADPAQYVDRITKALPDAAPAVPKQKRKLLVCGE